MHLTRRSAVFLSFLTGIVIFFAGLNVGKQIQNMDRSFVPPASPPVVPTASLEIQPTKAPASIKRFAMKACDVSFLAPSSLENVATASHEAELRGDIDRIFVTCDQSFIREQQKELAKTSSASATIAGQTIVQFKTAQGFLWTVRNRNRELVLIEVSKDLVPLVQETLRVE